MSGPKVVRITISLVHENSDHGEHDMRHAVEAFAKVCAAYTECAAYDGASAMMSFAPSAEPLQSAPKHVPNAPGPKGFS